MWEQNPRCPEPLLYHAISHPNDPQSVPLTLPVSPHHWGDLTLCCGHISRELQFCHFGCKLDFSRSNPTWGVLGRFLLTKTLNRIAL